MVFEAPGRILLVTTRYSSVPATMITTVKIAGTNSAAGFDPCPEEEELLCCAVEVAVELWEMDGDEAEVAEDPELDVVKDVVVLVEVDKLVIEVLVIEVEPVVVEVELVVAVDKLVVVAVLDVTDEELVVDEVEVVELVEVVEVDTVGAGNMTTLLLPVSVTQTFPEESATTPTGAFRLFCPMPAAPVPKLCWPSTTEALMPLEKLPANSKTREFPRSATQTLPE